MHPHFQPYAISQLSLRSGAHRLFLRFFGIFAIFDRNFAKIVAPTSNESENCVVHLKEQSLLKKLKTASKSSDKRQRNACSNYAPSNARCWDLQRDKKNIFAPTAGARCTTFPKLCMVIERIKIVSSIFDLTHILFLQGARKNSAFLTDARFLSNNSVAGDRNHMKFKKK